MVLKHLRAHRETKILLASLLHYIYWIATKVVGALKEVSDFIFKA